MIVSRVIVKNWRNFQAVDVPLGERVFLVGPNASGKSNFLDVFRFLRDIAKPGGGLQQAVSNRGSISKIRCLAATRYPNLEIEIHLANAARQKPLWKYAIGIKQEVRGYRQPLLTYERVWRGEEQILDRPDKSDKDDVLRLTQTHLEQINANAKFREIAKFFESVLYLHLVPQLVRYSNAFTGLGSADDPFGHNFIERVAKTPLKTRASRLGKIQSALRLAVPQLTQLIEAKDSAGVPHLEAVYEHWRNKDAKQREDQFSDGTMRLIGMFWALLENYSLLLLEEPELSLNSGIVSKLPGLMYRLQRQRKRQILLSTHSWDLLSDKGIGGEEVLLLTPSPGGTQIEVASSLADVRALLEGGMSVAEAALPRTVPHAVERMELSK